MQKGDSGEKLSKLGSFGEKERIVLRAVHGKLRRIASTVALVAPRPSNGARANVTEVVEVGGGTSVT